MIEWLEILRAACAQAAEAGWLPESLKYAFVVNALLCAMLIGPLLGGIGTIVVIKRLAFFSQAVGQAALTGVALGILLGEPYTSPYVSLFGFCILFGLVMNFTRNRTKIASDTLIGVYLSISIAVGACLLLFVTGKVNMHVLDQVLFGSILTVDNVDMAILVVISVLCVLLGFRSYNRMLLVSFNPSLARVRNVHPVFLDYVFIFMITIITVASVKIIGAVLVEALLLIPAAAARNISGSVRGFFFSSVVIATLSCLIGIFLPMQLRLPVPSGGAIIIVGAVFFLISAAIQPLLAKID
ncbi:metal ABC transporter permease [Desulfomonile tiedjei]|uniref:ABC-type Mn2+/Zn2+ transport system, permease component n=1 Tax=Desulfomonile tiedjei (strain ATCC 49306 / DSM 6799 / DCB-1) TaxID=706587 RepID=I4CCW3_DESTA|nr:metal ABC transporter permease [Desulfomonile tiedjei]AFM27404.1 ABC-type Mn2+/Zn2+ transport system, permease component [Desulfomonile tiedjei DSM 6799]